MQSFFCKLFSSAIIFFFANSLMGQESYNAAKLVLPIGHTSFINQLVYSYDGTKIATTSADHTSKIWDVNTGKLLIDFNGFGSQTSVISVAFNHIGNSVAISFGSNILLADPNTGHILDTLTNKDAKEITYLKFSNNDSIIYAFCNGALVQEVNSWNVFSKKSVIYEKPCITDLQQSDAEIKDYLAVATRFSIEVYDTIGKNEWSIGNLSNPKRVQFSSKDSIISFLDYRTLNFYHLSNSDTAAESTYKINYLPSSLDNTITEYSFSPDRKTLVLISTTGQQKAIILDAKSLDTLKIIEFPAEHTFNNLKISPDSKYFAFSRNKIENKTQKIDSTLILWNRETKDTAQLNCPQGYRFEEMVFSPNSKQLISWFENTKPILWDLQKAAVINKFEMYGKGIPLIKAFYSNDGSRIIQVRDLGVVEIWDALAIKKIAEITNSKIFDKNDASQSFPVFNKDASVMAEIILDKKSNKWGIGIWNTVASKNNYRFLSDSLNKNDTIKITSLQIFSDQDSTSLLTTNAKGIINLWKFENKTLVQFTDKPKSIEPNLTIKDTVPVSFAKFSPNGKMILGSAKGKITAWKISDGSIKYQIKDLPKDTIYSLNMSPNALATKFGVMHLGDTICKVYDIYKGALLKIIKPSYKVYSMSFSDDETKLVTYSLPDENFSKPKLFTEIWNLNKIDSFDSNSLESYQSQSINKYFKTTSIDFDDSHFTGNALIKNPVFSPDAKNILTVSANDPAVLMLWNIVTHDSTKLKGHSRAILSANYSKDGKYIMTASLDNTSKIWKNDGTLMFTMIGLPDMEYLVMDSLMRFDGSNEAKKNLYVTCGDEIIDLEQFEDLCWEQDLVEKTLGFINRPIQAKSLNSVQLCSTIPLVVTDKITEDTYYFSIYKRKGDIGNIELYVNNKRVEIYHKSDLTEVGVGGSQYQLKVDKKLVTPYFLTNVENEVYLLAYTSDNKILSRGQPGGIKLIETGRHKAEINVRPDVYLVSVGVKDYKGGVEMNLLLNPNNDAKAISKAVVASSRKLFNLNDKDSINHVFSYLFTSDSIIPNKLNIMNALDSIRVKAKADDIFIFFFAGHGIYNNSTIDLTRNQLYLLTSESTSFDLSKETEQSRAISSDELLTKLQYMKMSNQIIILDACNSGSLNQDIKVLEKLNDKQGTFILAGSAADKLSYESENLKHGFLSYSLLQGIKEGSILHSDDNGIKNIIGASDWLGRSRELVMEKTKEIRVSQSPQVFGKNSFDVGKVDNTVTEAISLEKLKKIIGGHTTTCSNCTLEFQIKWAQGVNDSLPYFLNNYITKNHLSSEITYNDNVGSNNNAYKVEISNFLFDNKKNSVTVRIQIGIQVFASQTFTSAPNEKNQLMNSIAKFIVDTISKTKINTRTN